MSILSFSTNIKKTRTQLNFDKRICELIIVSIFWIISDGIGSFVKSIMTRDLKISTHTVSFGTIFGSGLLLIFLMFLEKFLLSYRTIFKNEDSSIKSPPASFSMKNKKTTNVNAMKKMKTAMKSVLKKNSEKKKEEEKNIIISTKKERSSFFIPSVNKDIIKIFIIPSFFLAIAAISGSQATKRAGVTLNYIFRGLMPIMTCLYSFIFIGERYSKLIILFLIIIFIGTLGAGWNVGSDPELLNSMKKNTSNISLETIFWLFFACCISIGMNISLKEAQKKLENYCKNNHKMMSKRQQYTILVIISAMWSTIIFLLNSRENVMEELEKLIFLTNNNLSLKSSVKEVEEDFYFSSGSYCLILILSWFIEQNLTFVLIGWMSPLSFSILSVFKRLSIIFGDQMMLKHDMIFFGLNGFGLIVATFGGLGYIMQTNTKYNT